MPEAVDVQRSRRIPIETERPDLSIKYSSTAVDYLDLSGALRCVMVNSQEPEEVVDCVLEAWNKNLLWFYKIHLQGEVKTQTRHIPWSAELLSRVLAVPRLAKHIRDLDNSVQYCEMTVLQKFQAAFSRPSQAIQELAKLQSERAALRGVYERELEQLKESGIIPPATDSKWSSDVLQAVIRAAENLEKLTTVEPRKLHAVPYASGVSAGDFVKRLPKIDGIFAGSGTGEFRLDLRGSE